MPHSNHQGALNDETRLPCTQGTQPARCGPGLRSQVCPMCVPVSVQMLIWNLDSETSYQRLCTQDSSKCQDTGEKPPADAARTLTMPLSLPGVGCSSPG